VKDSRPLFTHLDGPIMPDDPVDTPPDHRQRFWALVLGALVFRILNSLHWVLAGGLGWGFGASLGGMVPLPGAATVGGAVGLALVMFGVLTIGLGHQSEYTTPIHLAAFGGTAIGSATLVLLNPFGRELNYLIGGGAGFFSGMFTAVMKQYFAPVSVLAACAISVTGAVLFQGVGTLFGSTIGWAAAGALALFLTAILAEYMRREPPVEIDANGQPVWEAPRRESLRRAISQSWSLLDPIAWVWNGLLAGLLASSWVFWVADHPDRSAARPPFLACGGFAAFVIIMTRLGIRIPWQAPPTDVDKGQADREKK
jgi:hypothetical protein